MDRDYLSETRHEPIHGAHTRIRPLRTVEVQVLQEQKTCLAGDGLSKKSPTHTLTVNGTALKQTPTKPLHTPVFIPKNNYTINPQSDIKYHLLSLK